MKETQKNTLIEFTVIYHNTELIFLNEIIERQSVSGYELIRNDMIIRKTDLGYNYTINELTFEIKEKYNI